VLPAGSYVMTLDGRVRCPIHVRVGSQLDLAVDLAEAADLRPGEILIPGGTALLERHEGGHGRLLSVDVPSFVIGELPVSFAEYLEFLADRHREDPAAAEAFHPRMVDGPQLWRWTGATDAPGSGGFEPAAVGRLGGERADLEALPTFGVDVASAEAYLAWLARRTGLPYRLPTEIEWEKAARGTDGRRYPWGDRFDASFCKMRESRQGPPRPERRGTFPTDVSPYGVRDLAGGVADWVVPSDTQEPGVMCTRGGAWTDHAEACRVASRRTYLAVERSLRVGFRIARATSSRTPRGS
jgi:eukaryotic-like serine/threonine-protein kinase